jgi:hypothetical protein
VVSPACKLPGVRNNKRLRLLIAPLTAEVVVLTLDRTLGAGQ